MGLPTKEHFLFDVESELELQGHGVTFMSSQDLEEFHRINGGEICDCRNCKGYEGEDSDSSDSDSDENDDQECKRLDVYSLVVYLMRKNRGSSFFIDELPFIPNKQGKKKKLNEYSNFDSKCF